MPFKKNFEVCRHLRAGTWASQSTFTSFYLRDVIGRSMDTFFIGPVVASQLVA